MSGCKRIPHLFGNIFPRSKPNIFEHRDLLVPSFEICSEFRKLLILEQNNILQMLKQNNYRIERM